MIKLNKKIIISIALIILIIFTLSTNIFAISDLEYYNPGNAGTQNNGSFLAKAGVILGWIQYTGIIVSIFALTIIGLKYLFSSVEGKAEYKKTMGPYVLGCFLLMGASVVVGIIANIAEV